MNEMFNNPGLFF